MTSHNNVFEDAADALRAVREMVLDGERLRSALEGSRDEVVETLERAKKVVSRAEETAERAAGELAQMRHDVASLEASVTALLAGVEAGRESAARDAASQHESLLRRVSTMSATQFVLGVIVLASVVLLLLLEFAS